MTIESGDVIQKFGTQTEVTAGAQSLTAGAFSTVSNIVAFQNADDVPEAHLVLVSTLAAALANAGSVGVYIRRFQIQGSNSETAPTLDSPYVFVGAFPMGTGLTVQNRSIRILLQNSQPNEQIEFYFKNDTSQNLISYRVYIRPVSTGQKA